MAGEGEEPLKLSYTTGGKKSTLGFYTTQHIPYDPEIPIISTYPKEMKI